MATWEARDDSTEGKLCRSTSSEGPLWATFSY